MNLNYLDIIIIVLVFVFGVAGWRKGVILEVASLLGLGLGLYGAFHFSDYTAEKLVQWVEINPKYLGVISFIVTFLVLALVVNLLGKLLSKVVKNLNLGFLDHIGGFVVGVAKGILLCSLLVMLLNVMNLRGIVKDDAKKASVLYPWVEQAVPYVYQGFDLVKEAVQNAATREEDDSSDKEGSASEADQPARDQDQPTDRPMMDSVPTTDSVPSTETAPATLVI